MIELVEVAPPPENVKAESLADRLEASVWEVLLPGVEPADARAAVAAFLAVERAEVSRMTKNGVRTFDARQAVVALEAAAATRAPERPGRVRVRYCDWSYATSHRLSDPTMSSPDSPRSATWRRPRPPRSPGWRKAPSTSRPARCPTHWHRTGTSSAPEATLRRPGCEARGRTTRLRRTSARAAGGPTRQPPRGAAGGRPVRPDGPSLRTRRPGA